jgi:hypothetical protein
MLAAPRWWLQHPCLGPSGTTSLGVHPRYQAAPPSRSHTRTKLQVRLARCCFINEWMIASMMVWMNEYLLFDLARTKQPTEKPHSLFNNAHYRQAGEETASPAMQWALCPGRSDLGHCRLSAVKGMSSHATGLGWLCLNLLVYQLGLQNTFVSYHLTEPLFWVWFWRLGKCQQK